MAAASMAAQSWGPSYSPNRLAFSHSCCGVRGASVAAGASVATGASPTGASVGTTAGFTQAARKLTNNTSVAILNIAFIYLLLVRIWIVEKRILALQIVMSLSPPFLELW